MNDITTSSIVQTIEQVINLLYNEPVPAVRVALAQALGHGFAAIVNAAKPGSNENGGYETLLTKQPQSTATLAEHASAFSELNQALEHQPVSTNRNAPLPHNKGKCANDTTPFQTIPYRQRCRGKREHERRSVEPHRKPQHSPKIRQQQSKKRQITQQALDKLNWAELGILEEHRTCNDGTVVSKSLLCDQHGVCSEQQNSHTTLSTTFSDTASETTVVHQQPLDSEQQSETGTIQPEDSASNVGGHCETKTPTSNTPQQSALGSLVSSVLTGWNKNKGSTSDVCLEGYRNVYQELRKSNFARTLKPTTFRVDTETFESHMEPELGRILNLPQDQIPSKYMKYVMEQWAVERNTWATLNDPDNV